MRSYPRSTNALGWRSDYSALHVPEAKTATQREPWSFRWQMLFLAVVATAYGTYQSFGGDAAKGQETPAANLTDAATTLFPHVAGAARTVPLRSSHSVTGRPDIQSFGFDLGGSTCACTLQWDREQYWQRVMYGQKYVCGHVLTPFLGYIVLQRWQWVMLFKIFNEVVEELAMVVSGRWAAVQPIQAMESRYDSLVNDILLTGVPFVSLGVHLVYVVGIPDPFAGGLRYDWASVRLVVLGFAWWLVFNTIHGIFNKWNGTTADVAGVAVDIGKIVAYVLQMGLLCQLWVMRAWQWKAFRLVAVCKSLLWIPFVFYTVGQERHEQVRAFLSLALAGAAVSGYHYWYTDKDRRVLAVAAVPYLVGLATFYLFGVNSSLAAPADLFYYHSGWCGITDGPNACQYITLDP